MIHSPIRLDQISLTFPHKVCFENVTLTIHHGDRIAIIGRNGSGKSSLLNILLNAIPFDGKIHYPHDLILGSVPQLIDEDTLSGAERFQNALTRALSVSPNCLLLDEPTNHLDQQHRKKLMRMLNAFAGTLIVVSHDVELLRMSINRLWHIDNGKISVFSGNYDDYIRDIKQRRLSIEQKLSKLNKQKKETHVSLMKEQQRAAKSRAKGKKSIEQRKWPTIVSKGKALRAEETSGRKRAAITETKQDLIEQLAHLHVPEIIVPTFSINASKTADQTILTIQNGSISYPNRTSLIKQIDLSLYSKDRIAIQGDNGCGKSTLIKAILNDPRVIKSGEWRSPKQADIGYLDQHYGTLHPEKTVIETIEECVPTWSLVEMRRYLNDFLFSKNAEVYAKVNQLSGGEKARLSLAQIAVKTPKLLILDEITNNLDLETKQHVIQVLRLYPAAMIIISHDPYFLNEIGIDERFEIRENGLICIRGFQIMMDNFE
jgi:ATPase subunit of ABC transporter with duplicated ATPase domains